jgi:putative oxidoreductase
MPMKNSIAQKVVSILGRGLLVAIFLFSALGNKIPNFDGVAQYMASHGVPSPKLLLIGAITFLLAGGVSVLLGFKARFGATLLLIFLALATYYFHAFWNAKPEAAQQEMIQFMKNTALAGAMLMIIANGSGAGSIDNLLSAKLQNREGK